MVYKRSEYGLQFKVSSHVKNVPVYKEHLSYRHLRRERECAHTPISWDAEVLTESSDSDEKCSPDEEISKLPLADLVIAEEEEEKEDGEDKESKVQNNQGDKTDNEDEDDDVAKEKREAKAKDEEKKRDVQFSGQEKSKDDCDVVISKENEALRKSAKEKLSKYASKENKNQPTSSKDVPEKKLFGKTFLKPKIADDKLFVKRTRPPPRPDRQVKMAPSRPKSAPSCRDKSAKSSRPQTAVSRFEGPEQPFLNFGGGANNRTLGDMKTFNVKASTAVYPAALRAKKRNQLLIEKLQDKQRQASLREKKRKARFNERMARQTATWESEYRRSFPCYENTIYHTSEREPRKQKSHFTT